MPTILLSIIIVIALIVVLAGILHIPFVQTTFIWIAVFIVTYAPSIITIIIVLSALVILPIALLSAIYGLPVLVVLFMLAIFAIWSKVAKYLLWAILIVGLLVSFFYQPANDWLHKELPALNEWKSTSKEKANIKIQESSLSMKDTIRDSRVTVGTFGKILKNGVGYDEFGAVITGLAIEKDQSVKSMGKVKSQEKTGDEGMIQIMLPNKHGNFIDGVKVFIPIRNVVWEKQVVEEEKKAVVTPPPPVVVPSPPVMPSQTIVTPPTPAVIPSPPPPIQKVVPRRFTS